MLRKIFDVADLRWQQVKQPVGQFGFCQDAHKIIQAVLRQILLKGQELQPT